MALFSFFPRLFFLSNKKAKKICFHAFLSLRTLVGAKNVKKKENEQNRFFKPITYFYGERIFLILDPRNPTGIFNRAPDWTLDQIKNFARKFGGMRLPVASQFPPDFDRDGFWGQQ